jgi:beta-N-acetylhexosaminidase
MVSQRIIRAIYILCVMVMILCMTAGQAGIAFAQSTDTPVDEARQKAEELLAIMTPEEKVGQLFLVAFDGTEIGPESEIFELITRYNIGGVIVSADHDNIPGQDLTAGSTVEQVFNMIRQMQINRWTVSQTSQDISLDDQGVLPAYIPLFIGMAQEGDGYKFDQILSGMTMLPNQMAIGATWDEGLSSAAGKIIGEQLSTLGVNLLLGPSLDVLETQLVPGANELGTRTFGGDPYWVSKLGQAYTQGVHEGSQGRVAVIAKHFPGLGSADRPIDEEISTVRKTLEELKSIELSPFYSVTGGAPDAASTVDGLLASHIRYQGLQGNIRSTTKPFTFDQQAFNLVMQLPQLESWRSNGGLVISDDLGSQAVRDFYLLTDQRFDITRRVALDAFLAGNDLLYVSDFSSDTSSPIESARKTLEFFAQKYGEDLAFAQRVDEAVLRILMLKYRIYGDFFLYNVIPAEGDLARLDESNTVPFDVARQGATLISPSQVELAETLPSPPGQNDRIVIVTDTREGKQCSNCTPYPLIARDAMQQIVQRRYGQDGTGQIQNKNISSYTLEDLEIMLDGSQGGETTQESRSLEQGMQNANWVVFNMLDNDPAVPSFETLSRFLAERQDLIQDKKLVVFGFNAPYYLDETDISKLTAYYGLYSKAPEFIDVATYLLFQDNIQPVGSPPVSVPGINYDVNEALFPNPDQVIPLNVTRVTPAGSIDPTPVAPGQIPDLKVGDTIDVQTDLIYDNNNRPVPDGTPVDFLFSIGGEANPVLLSTFTTDGQAGVTYTIRNDGTIVVRATSQPAQSEFLLLTVSAEANDLNGTPTAATEAMESSATSEITQTPVVIPPEEPTSPPYPGIGDWAWAVLITITISWLIYWAYLSLKLPRWGIRAALLALIGGLIGYSYLALRLPGSAEILQDATLRMVILISIAGAIIGLALAILWQQISKNRKKKAG